MYANSRFMKLCILSLIFSLLPFMAYSQRDNRFDLSSVKDVAHRSCWQQLLNDASVLTPDNADVIYSFFFGELYSGFNGAQRHVVDSMRTPFPMENGYCSNFLQEKEPVYIYPNPNQGNFYVSAKLPDGLTVLKSLTSKD